MRPLLACAAVLGLTAVLATPANADVIYNNLTPNNAIAMATRPDTATFEIESADDFVLGSRSVVNSTSFVGLAVPGTTGGAFSVAQVVVEIYRVFPFDSNVGRTSGAPIFSTSQVPTRVNSPSDVAFDSRDSAESGLTFTTATLAASFTALNSIQPGGIHPAPGQNTGGNGALTGQELQLNVTFTTPFALPADHYFFVPQVLLSNGAQFYWLSASRPIAGVGTTPFPPGTTDLQAWTRDQFLDPDWLRVGTDIVGAGTFNAAFSLNGTLGVPEPSTLLLLLSSLGLVGLRRRSRVLP